MNVLLVSPFPKRGRAFFISRQLFFFLTLFDFYFFKWLVEDPELFSLNRNQNNVVGFVGIRWPKQKIYNDILNTVDFNGANLSISLFIGHVRILLNDHIKNVIWNG